MIESMDVGIFRYHLITRSSVKFDELILPICCWAMNEQTHDGNRI